MENTNQMSGEKMVDANHLLPSPHCTRSKIGLALGVVVIILSVVIFYVTSYFGIVLLLETILAIAGLVFSILGLRHQKKWVGVTGVVVNSLGILFVLVVFVLGLMQGAYIMGLQDGSGGMAIPQIEG